MPGFRSAKVAAICTEDLCDAIVPSTRERSGGGHASNGNGEGPSTDAQPSSSPERDRSGLFQAPFSHDAIMMSTNTGHGSEVDDSDPIGALTTEQDDTLPPLEHWNRHGSMSTASPSGRNKVPLPGIAVAHTTLLAALLMSDALYYAEHEQDDRDMFLIGICTVVVYLLLGMMIWIIPMKCSFYNRVHLSMWIFFYLLHGAVAVLSAEWRQDVNPSFDEQCTWSAYLLCLLQFLIQSLYQVDVRVSFPMSVVLTVIYLVVAALRFTSSTLPLLQGVLPLVAAALAIGLREAFAAPSEASVQVEELRQILKPLLQGHHSCRELKTRHERVVKQLNLTLDSIKVSRADAEVARLLNTAVNFLLSELKSPHLLSLIPDNHVSMKGASPQTVQFLQHTLGQHNARVEVVKSTELLHIQTPAHGAPPIAEGDEAMQRSGSDQNSSGVPSMPPTPARAKSGRSVVTLAALDDQDMKAQAHDTFDQVIGFLTKPFRGAGVTVEPPALTDDVQEALHADVGQWRFDSLKLGQLCHNRPLVVLGSRLVVPYVHELEIQQERIDAFLYALESRYREGMMYHNSTHAADVMNSLVYLLRLKDRHVSSALEPIEKLAALTAAASHDVGHTGQANRFHVTTRTALAMLYNDQSPLENMHCALAFALLRTSSCNFMELVKPAQATTFRTIVVQMILDTDLSKHIQMVSKFRQEYLSTQLEGPLTQTQRRDVLSFMLKCCDVSHSTKPFNLHLAWTLRISCEFFDQGDLEVDLGLQCSPFCDRHATNIAESQRGFFDFIVSPLFNAMDEFLNNSQFRMEVLHELETNNAFWKMYSGLKFDYEDPMANLSALCTTFKRFLRTRATHSPRFANPGSTERPTLKSRSGSLEELPKAPRLSDPSGAFSQPEVFSTRSAPMPGGSTRPPRHSS
mmetsp:Transcript_31613/g.73738  ORF Transcript_31613/g.73738 Transcript_31613/m.73738 type:complete len:913 (-) Transcript_31613:167-2905(-)